MDFLTALPWLGGGRHEHYNNNHNGFDPRGMMRHGGDPRQQQVPMDPRQQQQQPMMDHTQRPEEQEDTDNVQNTVTETVSSSSSKHTDPDISDFSSKVKLPSADVIQDAFKHLTDFSMAKMLPPNLKTPLNGLSPELLQQVDKVNVNLELNIKQLFSNDKTKAEMADIKEALISIVTRNDPYLMTPEQQKVDRERLTQRAMGRISKSILRFYPHLLLTMRALLAYDAAYRNETFGTANHPAAITFREWMKVLGYLQSIHSVIIFAAKQQLLSLDGFPMKLSEFNRYTQAEIDTLQKNIIDTEDKLSKLQLRDLERKKKLNEVAAAYQGLPESIANLKMMYNTMQAKLEALTDPARIAEDNVSRIEQAFSQ